MHACLKGGEMNPRKVWCFKFEDYMGHMRRLATSCKNAYGVEVCKNVLHKWVVAEDWMYKYSYIMKK